MGVSTPLVCHNCWPTRENWNAPCEHAMQVFEQGKRAAAPAGAASAPRDAPRAEWRWFGHAAHFICARWCQFHLATLVGDYVVSTVGEYWPERVVREIHARLHDAAWFAEHAHLKGDAFDAAYMERFGYQEVGYERTYETMVFKAGAPCTAKGCNCGLPVIDGSEEDFAGYTDAGAATAGHLAMCEKWARKRTAPPSGPP